LRNCGSIGRGFPSNRDMKRALAMGVAATALACLCVLAVAQVGSNGSSPSASALPWLGNAQSNVVIIPSPPGTTPHPLLAPASNPAFGVKPFPPGTRLSPPSVPPTGVTNLYWILRSNPIVVPSTPPGLPPGVYRTVPYGCIVVVPGPLVDDKCIVNSGGGNSSMPIIKPDLQFIPWTPAK
jgi:hypothetical protein